MARYKVEFKAFKTGEWYTKMETDNIGSAYSVAQCHTWGRASRVTDIDMNSVIFEEAEKDGAAEIASKYKKL